ncbi:histidine kinase [Ruminococcus sp.]|uniref:sensor histidine kinase n=1 Tax=Ruminococcus sp. TaxID=41978 RepID=UPI0025CF154C|nr:histidine kinase [Ruminococcus sp.]MBQ8966881.1 sensor histidine kinase [Ruminococcus sp.]
MDRLIEKLALLLICLLSFSGADSFAAPVAAFLIAVTVSALVQVIGDSRVKAVMLAGCAGLCAVLPEMFFMLPLLLYDALWEKKWWLVLTGLGVLGSVAEMKAAGLTAVCVECAVSVMLYMKVSKLEQTVDKLKDLRDEVTEKNMQLKVRNDAISRAQDSEIHIATLKERNRIAREIHDNVGHMLTRSLLQAGALMIINKDEAMREPLESLKGTLDTAMTSIRQSVHDLHDDSIDLKRSIEESIAAVDGRFTVKFDYDMDDRADGRVKLCILGVIKEGLSNAVKHSSGDRIGISVQEHPGFYRLVVEDNGVCSDIEETGIGLGNMRERAESLGGKISFTPSEKGFRIFMSIPKG